jgi:hypothetical protein
MKKKMKDEGDGFVELLKHMNKEEVRSQWFRYKLLAVIRKKRLYKPGSFEEFAEKIGISRVEAIVLARIGETLNVDEFSEVGVWNSIQLSRLPAGRERDALLQRAPSMSREELAAAVRSLKLEGTDHE